MKKLWSALAFLLLLAAVPGLALAADTPIYVGNLTENFDTNWQAVGTDYLADEILASLKLEGLSDTQKVRKVYDWVVQNCSRDFSGSNKLYINYGKLEAEIGGYANRLRQAYQSGQAAVYSSGPQLVNGQPVWDTSVDNAFYIEAFGEEMALYREGNCAHFASLFAIMMNHLGYETHVIGGAFINSNGSKVEHKWNYALIDGKFYYFDTRMDNAGYVRTGNVPHNYFMVADEEAWAKRHEWNRDYTKAIREAYNRGERAAVFASDAGGDAYFGGYSGSRRITDSSGLVVISVKGGVTYVPLRFISDFFGAGIDWQGKQILLDYEGARLTLDLANKTATKGGASIKLDNPPYVDGGVTYVPLRFVAEGFGAQITYENGAVIISNGSESLGIRLNGVADGQILVELY